MRDRKMILYLSVPHLFFFLFDLRIQTASFRQRSRLLIPGISRVAPVHGNVLTTRQRIEVRAYRAPIARGLPTNIVTAHEAVNVSRTVQHLLRVGGRHALVLAAMLT